ncbi:hypothetical protein [Azospirillum sp. SYSU D00513]|uniref:hypothetical protein n=1 Tax=Azospirillum sp. SYSU D00513 TaxID=2812561 RepID=UPI001A95BB8B|nr:hypothetical protein [Azospirillum sp. SYSU D00513]
MTGMMMYVAFGLMVVTVISNRYWRRQLAATRQSIVKMKDRVDEVSRDLSDLAAHYTQLNGQCNEAETRTTRSEQELQATLLELEQKKAAPMERYYIFDRLENRSGRFWEAAIRNPPSGGSGWGRPGERGWIGVRRYILLAETEQDARARLSARFPARSGFELVELVPCRLNGLMVNRVPEFSTFRRPSAAEDDSRTASRRSARAPRA